LVFFSIDIEVFKIAGGFLLMFTALSMINGSATKLEVLKEEAYTNFGLAKLRFEKVMVPLVIPMLAGPGSITTVLLLSFRSSGSTTYAGLSGVLFFSYFFLFIVFSFSYKVENKVDDIVF
tara:strand:+ start:77943 stop:78302 length:360 start_codon:yes stop_codon:yes gene_type:complete